VKRARSNAAALARHNRRAALLDSLALLSGCTATVPGGFPDGGRPDVLRLDLSRRLLFVGDAKNTEPPTCRETQARLMAYIRWLSAHVQFTRGRAVLAVCFARRGHSGGWRRTLSLLAEEAALMVEQEGVRDLADGCSVAWVVLSDDLRGQEEGGG